MKVLLVLCILSMQLIFGQTPAPAAIPNESANRATAPSLTAAELDLLKSYFEMLRTENASHRTFLKEYYWAVFGAFTALSALLGVFIVWLTSDTLKKAASRVDERFESEVKAKVQARVAQFEKELRAAEEGVSEKLRNQNDEFQRKLQDAEVRYMDLEKTSRERFDKMDVIHSSLIEGRVRYVAELYVEAERFFDEVLKLDKNHVLALTFYGVCLSFRVPPEYDKALAQLDLAIENDEDAWLAYYNRACVRFLKNNKSLAVESEADLILKDLKRARDADSGYREWARLKDKDWEEARSDPRFLELVNGP